jgi:MlaD protein
MDKTQRKIKAKDLGAGILLVSVLFGILIIFGGRAGLWEEKRLVLTTVSDTKELEVGSPVYFKGIDIGKVGKIRPPEPDLPGFKLRMEVEKTAFLHMPLDALVRIDGANRQYPDRVTILPGREKSDWSFPGKVKVLKEVTDGENTVRIIRDVLDGIENVSKAKATEVEMMELKGEIKKLKIQLKKLQEKNKQE